MAFTIPTTTEGHVVEAHLPMNQSHDELRGHIRKALHDAEGITPDVGYDQMPYIMDVFPSHVVYQHKGGTHRRPYTATFGERGTDPAVTLGKARPVHRAYVDTKGDNVGEAQVYTEAGSVTVTLDTTQVQESVAFPEVPVVKESHASKIPIKIIGPGWGSMAYYSEAVLKRDGPRVFAKGTHMMWNHATSTEEAERPEGNLDALAGVLTTDAAWRDSGPKGPGLYAEAKVFSDYAQKVAEMGPHIGVSINAAIRGREGTVDGRSGRIAEEFVKAYSTDFVTKAGAGGAPVVPAREAQREPQQETHMEQDVKERDDLRTENVALKARLTAFETASHRALAIAAVGTVLKEAGVTYQSRLLERACQSPVMVEGTPDPAWVQGIVADFSEGQTAEVTHLGEAEKPPVEGDVTARLRESLKALGVPEAGLDIAVKGRA